MDFCHDDLGKEVNLYITAAPREITDALMGDQDVGCTGGRFTESYRGLSTDAAHYQAVATISGGRDKAA